MGAGKPAWWGCCLLAPGEDGGSLLLERAHRGSPGTPAGLGASLSPQRLGQGPQPCGGSGEVTVLVNPRGFHTWPPSQTGNTKTAEDQCL